MGVVFGGEIEEEGEERVGVRGDVRLEAGRGGGVSWWFGFSLEGREKGMNGLTRLYRRGRGERENV